MKRRHPCDACGAERKAWQRLCGSCWGRLPPRIRDGLTQAWRHRERAAWRDWVRAARAALAGAPPARDTSTVYDQIARRLGEHS